MLERTTDPTLAHEKLRREIEHAPIPEDVLPKEGAIQKAIEKGDVFLKDPADDNRTDRGTIAWVTAEPDWKNPEVLWVQHVWGESVKHIAILRELCEWLIAEGYGDQKVGYARGPHPLTVVADQLDVDISRDGRLATTTPNRVVNRLKEMARR